MSPKIIVFAAPDAEYHAIEMSLPRRWGVIRCGSFQAMARNLADDDVAWVLLELDPTRSIDLEMLKRAIDCRRTQADALIRFELSRYACRIVLSILQIMPDATLSIRPFDSLELAVRSLANRSEGPSAHAHILRCIAPLAPSSVRDLFVTAALVASRRLSVAEFAHCLGYSERTVHARLASGRLPRPRQLIASMVALHSAWRLDRLGWAPKRAARAAGFTSQASFGNYLKRNVGATPSQLAETGGFDQARTVVESRIRGAGSSQD